MVKTEVVMSTKKKTYSASAFLYNQLVAGDPERERRYEERRRKGLLGAKLQNMRHKAGLTQREVAKQAGTTVYRISSLENGDYDGKVSDVSADLLERIVRVLGGVLVISVEESPV